VKIFLPPTNYVPTKQGKMKMNIVFHSSQFLLEEWQQAFEKIDASIQLHHANTIPMAEVDCLLTWKPTITDWQSATKLRCVIYLGAGIDINAEPLLLPTHTKILRLHDAGMKAAMCDYASYAVLHFQRRFDHFAQAQRKNQWLHDRDYRSRADTRIGVLGLGYLGGAVANHLHHGGYPISAWSRSLKVIAGINTYHGLDTMKDFLSQCDVLINMLPHTHETHHLLNLVRLSQLPKDAAVISLSRGAIIDTSALLEQLNNDHLRGAFMDVFEQEPLAKDSLLWQHPKVFITPHQSAPTQVLEAVKEARLIIQDCG
jgi:glyoxylate/hydroxypyruvate reductase A